MGTGKFMLRITLASSRVMRAGAFGLATVAAVVFSTDHADARRYRHHHRHHHHEARHSYNPPFASIVVDANSGATLSSNSPDSIRHPASLTKMMTLYLLFERLDAGKMSLDTEMRVSEHAAEQDPTKLGLRPGQTIRAEDAIKGLVTKSANDAAVVIAEAIGGDEDDFARMMTRKARALGMTRTVYRNASGLPDDDQVTTARDQATLGRALQDQFPRYYRYFATTSFTFRGRTIRGHNHLLGSVDGVDGIKTGYIRASGFNLVTNLKRGNRHLVGVVLGAAAVVHAMPPCAACWPKISTRPRRGGRWPRSPNAARLTPMHRWRKTRRARSRNKWFRSTAPFRSHPPRPKSVALPPDAPLVWLAH